MAADEMVEYLHQRDGLTKEQAAGLARLADEFGVSDSTRNRDAVLEANRAGPGETTLTVAELLQLYG
jgi:hypothetical protein